MPSLGGGPEQFSGNGWKKRQRENIGSSSCSKEQKNMTKGRYGVHGGQYIPETLMNAVNELEEAYDYYRK